MTDTTTRAVIYVRISQDRAGESLGVQRQEKECRELCDRSGWSVVDVLVDNDISAYSGRERPGYRRLLDMVSSGQVDVVVAWNTDRLHRRLVELVEYVDVCNRVRVTTHTVRTGPIDLSTPSGILVAQQLGAVAEYESRNRSARVVAAGKQRAHAGKYSGGPRPFGWEPDGTTPREDEQRALRTASDEVFAGASLESIARRWRAEHVPTVSGGTWSARRIRETLLRPRIAGLMQYRGQVIGLAEWDPVVSPEKWHALRQILEAPGRVTTHASGVAPRHLGSNRYRCGATLPDGSECGGLLRVTRSGDTRKPAYGCTRRPKLGVSHVTIPRDAVDELVREWVVSAMLEQGFGPVSPGERASDDEPADSIAEIEEAQTLIAAEFAADRMPAAAWKAANDQLAARMQAALARQASETVRERVDARLSGFDTDPYGVWDALPLDVRRSFMDDVVTVTVLPGTKGNYRYGADLRARVRFDPRL